MTRVRTALRASALALALVPALAAAQQAGTAAVVAGREYGASGLHRWLLGKSYRDLWTAPVTVPVLDLGAFAGGLTPTGTGGGNQTTSLRLRGADGREYAFRSVDKVQTQTLPEDLRHTLSSWAVQDQVSSFWPAAGVVAHPLEAAAGIPHTTERLFVMPDDPRLGEYRARFAGMLGTLEERPGTGRPLPPELAGADRIEDGDTFLVRLRAGPDERMDDREYLAVRLVDILLGDWDRHPGQYLWASTPRPGGGHLWRALPRDRDYAFVDYDGMAMGVGRGLIWNLVRFRDRIDLRPMAMNASQLDHRLLGGMERATWDSVTRAVRANLSDAAISSALAALPAEYRDRRGAALEARLRARRDDLARVSATFYGYVLHEAEAHGTDQADEAVVDRLPSGNVRVTLRPAGGGEPFFQREYAWTETREVRVYLHGGADVARVTGTGPEQVIVRVIGGEGDDRLADEGRAGHHTAFYDDAGSNTYDRRPHTKVDERPWTEVMWMPGAGSKPPRDWGFSQSGFAAGGGWKGGGVGPYVAVGPTWKRYGFRRHPHAVTGGVQLQWAPLENRFGVEYDGDFRYVGSPLDRTEVTVRATELAASRFFGYGNQADDGGFTSNHFRVWERQLYADAAYWKGLARRTWIVGALTGRVSAPEPEDGTPAGDLLPDGSEDFALAGGRVGFVTARGDSAAYIRNGWSLAAWGSGFPVARNDAGAFGGGEALATAYVSAGGRGPTLALRAGGEKVWGDFPFQYAATLGGTHSLRGYPSQRYAGDAAAYGSAELRQVVTRANLLVARGNLGVFGLADAGRVWYQGTSPGGWHTAYGGGLFFALIDNRYAVSAAYAQGETGRIHLQLGMPF